MILFLKVLYGGSGLLLELSVVGLEGTTRVDKSKLLILAESLVWACVEIGACATLISEDTGGTP